MFGRTSPPAGPPSFRSNDFDTVIASAKDLLGNLQVTSTNLNGILSSPEVMRSVRSLDRSLANLDHITRDASAAGVGALITSLRVAADSADSALKQAEATLAVTEGAFDNHRSDGGDLAGAIRELKGAARSVRVLADYLETHPDSLLLGRTERRSDEGAFPLLCIVSVSGERMCVIAPSPLLHAINRKRSENSGEQRGPRAS